jgi:DNA primase
MNIYQLVFGIDRGQVQCCFHDDQNASAGIGPEGQYNCLVGSCGAKAHDEVGFIAKYFGVRFEYATLLKSKLESVEAYPYTKNPITDKQEQYLLSIGLTDYIIKENFFSDGKGKLRYHHKWSGATVGTTWFNHPSLPEWNAADPKYKYGPGLTGGGMLTPYDSVMKYNTLIICEGEKDMLTARSMGIPNAVAKLGGANTPLLAGVNLQNKKIVLVYDCDEAGKAGAIADANRLSDKYKCIVKIVDLGLQNKEDLNDYFIKHHKKTTDFYNLLDNTPVYVPDTAAITKSKLETFVSKLTSEEVEQLRRLLNVGKGE